MKDAIGRTIGVIDDNAVIVACSDLMKIGETRQNIKEEMSYVSDVVTYGGFTYRPMSQDTNSEYIVFIQGEDELASQMSSVLAVALNNIKNYHDDKYDKTSFIKNVLLDNVLPGDMYIRSKELNFASDVWRVVFLIKFGSNTETSPFDIIQNMFPNSNQDYVISTGERDIVLVRELKPDTELAELEKTATEIVDTLASEFYAKISIGIGRLIYQLPVTLCEIFLNEVFQKGSIDALDRETLSTIQSFFENNLNVSETSRKMFVHRNTLVYRLDKIKKITGLDLREFENAITFKVALMVRSYLNSKNNRY